VDEFDEQLAEALKRLAEPGNPSGVADSIRARMAAGGPGGPKSGRVPAGWRRVPRWIVGVAIAVIVLGAGAGLFFALAPQAHNTSTVSSPSPSASPSATPTITTPPIAPSVTPTPHHTPTHHTAAPPAGGGSGANPPHHPTADTTSPMVGPTTVERADYCSFGQGLTDVVTTHATDNVAVASVSISWAGTGVSGSGTMTSAGHGSWNYSIPATNSQHQVTVTVTAHDAAGNSASDSTSYYDGCVIG
jgi:hypothetical protein